MPQLLSAEVVLCMHKTTILCQFGSFVTSSPTCISINSHLFLVGTVSLLYLMLNTDPEIAYVVHQCARFTHNPKASHGAAAKRICLYLHGTKKRGLILHPSKQLTIDCHIHADFAGQGNVRNPENPLCIKYQM